jgi:hypothetical protein
MEDMFLFNESTELSILYTHLGVFHTTFMSSTQILELSQLFEK